MTTSFHQGTEYCRGHNNRDENHQEEAHIDKNGWHETWVDEPIEKAYERLFGEALREYNERQKRADRRIKNYLQNVRQNKKLNECYEFIVQIGNEKNHPDAEISHMILDEYFKDFLARNEGLEVIGAYFHADEVGGTPHLHVDYIPVAEGKKTGLKIRNNLNSALKNLGYETEYVDGKMNSAEMQFQSAERKALNEICRMYGIEVENPNRKNYCSSQQLREARNVRLQNETRNEELSEREAEIDTTEKRLESLHENLSNRELEVSYREKKVAKREAEINTYVEAAEGLLHETEKQKKDKNTVITQLAIAIQQLQKQYNDIKKQLEEIIKKYDSWRNASPNQLREKADLIERNKCQSWQQFKNQEERKHRKNRSSGFER